MKSRCMKKALSIILALGMLSSFFMSSGIFSGFSLTVKAQEPDNNDDWLHVEGNQIVDMNGNPVWLTGTNWFGFNTGTNVFDGVWSCNMREALTKMADRGINFLRIPVSTEILTGWKNGKPAMPRSLNDYVNPELKGLNSLELFDFALDVCKEVGIKVMVDVHSPKSEAMGHNYPVWYDETYDTEAWISALEWLTERYKNDDTILAIDLKNEPHGKPYEKLMAKWDNSTDINNWKYAAETCAKRILKINPNLLIVIEGVEVYPKEGYDYTAVDEWGKESRYYYNWWGGNLRGVKDYPIDLGQYQKQVVYSPHDYGPLVHKQPWFYDGFTKETLYNDCWKDNWAYIYEEGIAPLLIGEWGGYMDGGPNEKWMIALRDYIVENRIHHTFWCYNANSGDTGGLVTHDFITWEEDKYELLKPALWQHNGKFVSLDHKVPLGSNGISLSDVYGDAIPTPTRADVPTPTVSSPVTLVYGDLNGDDDFNSIDFGLLKLVLLGLKSRTEINEKAADVDGNGHIDSIDYALMKQRLLGIIKKFPVEN
ncbi:endoglucanase [Acetivibrio clariflavus DSM 19732]|uniref:cellulase n=2 Tax=Acetivibrio clariflavus TaxID=288965 RepID=G8LY66_ACECE|nr:endoglucanase [Acetivibrio clariflavus DSM 19732]